MRHFIFRDAKLRVMFNRIEQPDHLTNTVLNETGCYYLRECGENETWFSFFFRNHNNHCLAKKLRDYKEESTTKDKWVFLINQYSDLPNNNGIMARLIIMLFRNAFSNYFEEHLNYVYLKTVEETAKVLKQIVHDYFKSKRFSYV